MPAQPWPKSSFPHKEHPGPYKIGHHPKWPKCDCSHVTDANSIEICTVYTNHSAGVAQFIADALNAFGPEPDEVPAAPSPHDENADGRAA